jgi:hypothetical protein
MCRDKTLNEIIKIRHRFKELIGGREPGEVYQVIALEFEEEANTIAAKKNCYGFYKQFLPEVRRREKLT